MSLEWLANLEHIIQSLLNMYYPIFACFRTLTINYLNVGVQIMAMLDFGASTLIGCVASVTIIRTYYLPVAIKIVIIICWYLEDMSRRENPCIPDLLFGLMPFYALLMLRWFYQAWKYFAWYIDPNDTKNTNIVKYAYYISIKKKVKTSLQILKCYHDKKNKLIQHHHIPNLGY